MCNTSTQLVDFFIHTKYNKTEEELLKQVIYNGVSLREPHTRWCRLVVTFTVDRWTIGHTTFVWKQVHMTTVEWPHSYHGCHVNTLLSLVSDSKLKTQIWRQQIAREKEDNSITETKTGSTENRGWQENNGGERRKIGTSAVAPIQGEAGQCDDRQSLGLGRLEKSRPAEGNATLLTCTKSSHWT